MIKKSILASLVLAFLLLLTVGPQLMLPVMAEGELVHDVAVTDVTPWLVAQLAPYHPCRIADIVFRPLPIVSWIEVNVTVKNEGDFNETFSVTAYYDNNTIGTQTVTDLAPLNEKNLIFKWNYGGVPYGTYVMSAKASVVPDEIDTADNTKIDGTVKVTIPGDLDGDGNVYTKDMGILGKFWRRKWPVYIPIADIDCDGYVYVKDLGILGKYWHKLVAL